MMDYQIKLALQKAKEIDVSVARFKQASDEYARVIATYICTFELFGEYRKELAELGLDPDDVMTVEECNASSAKYAAKEAAKPVPKPQKTEEEYEKELLEYQESLLEAAVFYLRARKNSLFYINVMHGLMEVMLKAEKTAFTTRKHRASFMKLLADYRKAVAKYALVAEEYRKTVVAYEALAEEYEDVRDEYLKLAPEHEIPVSLALKQAPGKVNSD